MAGERFSAGFRAAIPYAIAGFVLSMSFGVLAVDAGFPRAAAIVMSAIVFAGSAQFTALSVMAAGGGVGAAVAGAALMNSRFLPMGIALAPSLPGGPAKRAAQGQTLVDASWALAARGDGSFDRWFLFGATATQYLTWFSGTVVGAVAGGVDTESLGLDAIYPTFFLALLIAELRSGRAKGAAALGALIALALVPVAPAGVPILVASLAALIGIGGGGAEGRRGGSRGDGPGGSRAGGADAGPGGDNRPGGSRAGGADGGPGGDDGPGGSRAGGADAGPAGGRHSAGGSPAEGRPR